MATHTEFQSAASTACQAVFWAKSLSVTKFSSHVQLTQLVKIFFFCALSSLYCSCFPVHQQPTQ